jgi:hypothetical protein
MTLLLKMSSEMSSLSGGNSSWITLYLATRRNGWVKLSKHLSFRWGINIEPKHFWGHTIHWTDNLSEENSSVFQEMLRSHGPLSIGSSNFLMVTWLSTSLSDALPVPSQSWPVASFLRLTHNKGQIQSYVTTDGQSGSQAPIWGLGPNFYLSDSCGFVDVGRPLWREDGSVVCNCCWASPAQSFSGPSPAGLMTIFYCLRFETPPTYRARSPRNRVALLYPQALGSPFLHLQS